MNYNKEIKRLYEQSGLTQTKFAKLIEMDRANLSNIIAHRRQCGPFLFDQILNKVGYKREVVEVIVKINK